MTGRHHRGFSVASRDELIGATWVGSMETTYAKLVHTFGEPDSFSRGSATQWFIKTPRGELARIYDANYDDAVGCPLGRYAWRVSGYRLDVVDDIKSALGASAVASHP